MRTVVLLSPRLAGQLTTGGRFASRVVSTGEDEIALKKRPLWPDLQRVPLHRQAFDGDSLVEEVPPPADEPQLSPGRSYWWTGTEWVAASGHPDGKKALDEEFSAPLIAPLIHVPPARTIKLKKPDVAMPKLLSELPEAPAPDPLEEQRKKERELWAPVVVGPAYNEPPEPLNLQAPRFPWLAEIDQLAAGAIVVAVLLCWLPRLAGALSLVLALVAVGIMRGRPSKLAIIALVLAVPELVIGSVLAHNVSTAATQKAHTLAALNHDLSDAADVEHIVHVYEYQYGGPGTLAKYGWQKPKDADIDFVVIHRFQYCLSETIHKTTMTVHEDGVVGTTPCTH